MPLGRYLTAGVLLAIASSFPAEPASPGQPETGTASEYSIGVGDQLSVKFFYNPDLSEDVVVRPDGRISLQLVPEILAAGRTPAGLKESLRTLYSSELDRPEIAVIVRSFSAYRVYVDGEVARPGELTMARPLTVLQAIYRAGGFTPRSAPNRALLIRRSPDGSARAWKLNLKKGGEGGPVDRNSFLQPLDIVYIPSSAIAKLNSWVDHYIKRNIPIPFGFTIEVE